MLTPDNTRNMHTSHEARAPIVEVWTVNLDVPDALLNAALVMLGPDEQERANSYRNDIARRRYILSHAALRDVLAGHLKHPAQEITFQTGPNGKPTLSSPNPTKLEFNLTHTAGLALVATSLSAEVGIDVESIRPMRDAVAIAKRFFAPREAAALEQLDAAEQSATFLDLWTRKEAFVKATGQGIAEALARFEVSWGTEARLLAIDGDTANTNQWTLRSFTPAPGYLGALAVHMPQAQVVFHEFKWGLNCR